MAWCEANGQTTFSVRRATRLWTVWCQSGSIRQADGSGPEGRCRTTSGRQTRPPSAASESAPFGRLGRLAESPSCSSCARRPATTCWGRQHGGPQQLAVTRRGIHIILCPAAVLPLIRPPAIGYHVGSVTKADTPPLIRLRGRSIMALVLAPEVPLPTWLGCPGRPDGALAQLLRRPPSGARSGSIPREQQGVAELRQLLQQRGIRIIGTEGAHPSWAGIEAWGGRCLPTRGRGSRSNCLRTGSGPARHFTRRGGLQGPAIGNVAA